MFVVYFFFFQAEDGIRDLTVTGVQTCALPISARSLCLPCDDYSVCFAVGSSCRWLCRGSLTKIVYLRAHHRHRSEEHTSELQSQSNLVCRLLLEKKKKKTQRSFQQT